MSRKHWLLVERIENWQQDRADGFRQFGLPSSKRSLGSKIAAGDELFFYVSSGISAFADIREATKDGVERARGLRYDTPFPWRVATRPLLTLSQEEWVPLKVLANDLDLTRGVEDWRYLVRNSLRQLSEHDAGEIRCALARKPSR